MDNQVNLLVIITVSGTQVSPLMRAVAKDGFDVTQVDSRGGILHEATVSLLVGLDRDRLPRLLHHVRRECRRRKWLIPTHVETQPLQFHPPMIEAEVGGATVYALEVERFERI